MNIEHKLDLIQQIHREQAENERYLENYYEKDYRGQESQVSWLASFRFRLLVAVLLFLCFFVMDKKESVYYGIGSTEIVEAIDNNFSFENLENNLVKIW